MVFLVVRAYHNKQLIFWLFIIFLFTSYFNSYMFLLGHAIFYKVQYSTIKLWGQPKLQGHRGSLWLVQRYSDTTQQQQQQWIYL